MPSHLIEYRRFGLFWLSCGEGPQVGGLDICALFCMPLQIPARHVALVGKQCVDTGLRLRLVEDESGLAALLLHRVKGRDHDLSEGLMIGGHAMAE